MGVGGVALAAEIYNEIVGVISGKEWYLGKHSIFNHLIRGKDKKDNKNPDDSNQKKEIFTEEEVKKVLENLEDKPKGEIKSI